MSIIATEQEAKTIGQSTIVATNSKMCTKSRASEFGCNIAGKYVDNQLVQYDDLTRKLKRFEALFIANGGNDDATYFLIKGNPIAANIRRYILMSGEQGYYFWEGDTYGVNQPNGSSTVNLLHNESCEIYSVNGLSLGNYQISFTHDAYRNYTISWQQ